MLKKAIFLLSAAAFLILFIPQTKADELLDVQKQIDKNNSDLSSTQKTLDRIKKDLASLSNSLVGTQAQLEQAKAQLNQINANLTVAEADLEKKRTSLDYLLEVRNKQVRHLYQYPERSALELFLTSGDLTGFSENLVYQSAVMGDARDLIKTVNVEVVTLEQNRNSLAESKRQLDALTTQINTQLAALRQNYNNTSSQKNYMNNKLGSLQSTLKGLTDKQNQLIAAKIGSSIATGSLALADDANARVSFNPGFSPAFAAFSFGAYTHRNGMSQYGALGRANSGQSAEQILAAYYPGTSLNKGYPVPGTITVNGTNDYGQTFDGSQPYSPSVCLQFNSGGTCIRRGGQMSFSEYVKHLYEVPTSWPIEVLKAQAVAARSYAIKRGSPICPDQGCQEVKLEINSTAWQQAVDATAGWVLTGGSGSFQYSSTSGGYLNTSGWDTTDHSIGSWPGGAYESIGGSPWFYKGWYRAGTSRSGATCGRNHPWLTGGEFVDIINSWVVYTKGNNNDKGRVTTTDTACWGGNPYSVGEMKARADALGGSYNQVLGVSAGYSSGGYTSSINLVTDRGVLTIDGPTFRDIFNFRAPGYLVIKTALFNIEKK